MTTDIIPRTAVSDICAARDAAIATMGEAVALMVEAADLAREADNYAQRAHESATFTPADRSKSDAYQRLFAPLNPEASLETYRRQVDARCWMHIMTRTGMDSLMDRTAKEELYKTLCADVPPLSEQLVWDTLEGLQRDAGLIFQRGLARVFSQLDRRFRSHDGFKVGSRIILTRLFDGDGYWNYYSETRDYLADVERVFAVLDGNRPDVDGLEDAIRKDREGHWGAMQSEAEGTYFKIRMFKNGNAHLWMTRKDLVLKVNRLLADYYGEVLPDAVPADVTPRDIRERSTALSKDLQFYPTPGEVVNRILGHSYIHIHAESRVLEPSAGDGSFVREMLARGARVDAVEIHPGRLASLRDLERGQAPRLTVTSANFLKMTPTPVYDYVVMNPPFYGTHYMQHVMHAWEFLAPEGRLIAVLPATAEFGESKAHDVFRTWLKARRDGQRTFWDLPQEAFKESGTRVNTCYVVLRKRS